jgi:hypothetical protein
VGKTGRRGGQLRHALPENGGENGTYATSKNESESREVTPAAP